MPRIQKELRQFLGTCNCRHRFMVNFLAVCCSVTVADEKGEKWRWIAELQEAF
jgi:hypothetical protein